MATEKTGEFHVRDVYRRQFLLCKCGFSEELWDEMLNAGTPHFFLGKDKAVLREDLLGWMRMKATCRKTTPTTASAGQ